MSTHWLPTSRLRLQAQHSITCATALLVIGLATGCGDRPAAEVKPITPSMELSKQSAPIGSPIDLNYRFELGSDLGAIDTDYRVFVHFLDSHNQLLFTDDHDPPTATSSWEAGETVSYQRTMFIPLYPYLGTTTVQLGLYNPETGERLGMTGTENGQLAYQVAQVNLLDQKENIFLVYKEGWHQLESAPENPDVEWQWTKKEAVCSFRNPKTDSILFLEADTNIEAFEENLEVSIMIGEDTIDTFNVHDRDTFLKRIAIPAAALGDEDWVDLRIVNSSAFVPTDVDGLGDDVRELALRVYHLYLDDDKPGQS